MSFFMPRGSDALIATKDTASRDEGIAPTDSV
jgi:hypothetical protein